MLRVVDFYREINVSSFFVGGIESGVRKEFYENGQLRLEVIYENDNMEGKLKTYHKNGHLYL